MNKHISMETAIEYLMTNMGWNDEDGYPVNDADEKRKIITDLISGIPAADVRPVVRGKWVMVLGGHWWDVPDDDYRYYECSNCGELSPNDECWNFCPNCGADMREVTDND